MNIINIAQGITHGGVFHADDVFSAALLKLINPDVEIKRVFSVPKEVDEDTIVFDIGFGEFDHHQANAEVRENGVKYAAFGLLWRAFGYMLLSESDVLRFDNIFVQPLDNADNGGSNNLLSQVISSRVPNWNDEDQDINKAFFASVDYAKDILEREVKRLQAEAKAEEIVQAALRESKDDIVVLQSFVPWNVILVPSNAKFVVFPSNRGGYNAQAIPTTLSGRDQKVPFPKEWTETKPELIGQDVTFCHPGRFFIATNTLESAVETCKKAVAYSKG